MLVSRSSHGLTKIRLNQMCFVFSEMALRLIDEENTTSQASLVFIRLFEKVSRELPANMMEKCRMTPPDKCRLNGSTPKGIDRSE